jgi:hypothetical protein
VELLEDRSLPSIVPIDVIGHLPAAEYNQYIPNAVNFEGNGNFKDWGNEPFVAVNPVNPNQIVVSSFAYGNPIASEPGLSKASLWYSSDGGADWTIRFPMPFPQPGVFAPSDQTYAYDSNGVLHGALMSAVPFTSQINIFHGTTTDPNLDGENGRPATAWQWNSKYVNLPAMTQDNADQPWIAIQGNHVYVSYYFYNGNGLFEPRVSASADGGATFTQDHEISNGFQPAGVHPGVRLATDRVGNTYGIFATGPPWQANQPQVINYRLNESSDGGATWKYTKSSQVGGLLIDNAVSLQEGVSFGGVNRVANIDALAADPTGEHVYAVYGKRDPTGADRLYLAEFHPDGSGNLVKRANPVALSVPGQRSALPSIAVTDNGTIAVQYDTFTPGDNQFHVHLAVSTDHGLTFADQDVYDFDTTGIPLSFSGADIILGDYQCLIAVGNTVYGTFAGRGNVSDHGTDIDTTDKIAPFFYSVTLPTVSMDSATQTVNANAGTFGVRVNLSSPSTLDTTIPFTLGGTAVIGADYSGVTGSPLVIPAGQTSATITGTLIDDAQVTPNKTLTVTLGTPTNAMPGATTAATLIILETNDQPAVSFANAAQTTSENAGAFSVAINLSAPSTVDTAIHFSQGGTALRGANFNGLTASPLVILAGQTSGTISGTLLGDGAFDTATKTLILTLESATSATLGSVTASTVNIQQSDPPPTVSFASATQTVTENSGAFNITLNLSAASNVATTIPFTLGGTAVSGVNYRGVTASPLVIAAGQTLGTISGTLIDDGVFEPVNKTLILTLGAPTNAALGGSPAHTLTIEQSNPTVSFANVAQTVTEDAGTFSMTVSLAGIANAATTIPFTLIGTAVAGTDYRLMTASPLVIAAGQSSATISGTLLAGPQALNKTLTVTLGTPSNATLGTPSADTLTIIQPTTVSIADSSAIEPAPGGTVTMNFTVTRTGDPGPLTVAYTTVAGTAQPTTDFTPLTGTATFAAGSATATIAIPIFGNGVHNNSSLSFSVKLTGIGPTTAFASQQTFGTSNKPCSVAVADFNGDGKPDLAVANRDANTVSVLLNTAPAGGATPTFASQQTFATGTALYSVAVGDFNGDDKADLVVTNWGTNTASVLLNTTPTAATTPSFATPKTFATGQGPRAVAVGDFNGDGKPDLAVANMFASFVGTVSVLLNTTPTGAAVPTFATQRTFDTGSAPYSVTVGDFNGDGKPDLAVANWGFFGDVAGSVSVLLNRTLKGATTPSFAPQKTFATGNGPRSVAVGDFNGDGKPDLALANWGSSGNAGNTVSVLLNATPTGVGTPSFAPQKTFVTGTGPHSVAAADFNGDGQPDLVVANSIDNTVTVLLNTTAPAATTPTFVAQNTFATDDGPRSVVVGDFNGDGQADLVAANDGADTVSVLLNILGTITRGTATGTITVNAGTFSKFVVRLPGGNTLVAGKPFLLTAQAADSFGNPITSYSGPASVTVSASPADPQGNFPITGTLDSRGLGVFLGNLESAGSYTLTATAGSFSGTSESLTVIPATANYFTVAAPAAAATGRPFDVTVTAFDHFGNIATGYTGTIKLTSTDPAAATLVGSYTFTTGAGKDNGVHTFNADLKTGGSQSITATDSASTNPTITGSSSAITTRGLVVSAFTPTATGFTVAFNKPIVASNISLFGGTALGPTRNVTLVGSSNGPVNGTFIIDPSGTSATFKASNVYLATFFQSAVLPNDTWTATLVSGTGATGFFDALGGPLDGGNNAGSANYTTSFSTANDGKLALSIPDFARGPDGASSIKVPNDSGKGIPVTLSNVPAASGVTDVVFTLTYNPTLLTPTGAGTGDSSDTGSTFTMGAPVSVDATHSTVTFTWHNAAAQSGTVVLGDILANVPDSAANEYKGKEILALSDIKVNGADFTGVWANGLHVNAYFGDVTGDGKLSGLDVATASAVASGSSLGLAAYKLVDPAIVGDIAGDASIDATAVSDLASVTSNLPISQIPAIPTDLTITPGGPDPTLSLGAPQRHGDKEKGRQGESSTSPGLLVSMSPGLVVTVPVMLDDPHPAGSTGMEEAVLALTYDPRVLTVSSSDITLGSIPELGSGWHLVSVVDQATGQIGIDLYSTIPITAMQAGSLVNINFHVVPGLAVPATAVQLVSAVTPNGRSFSTEVADDQGQYVLSPGLDRLVIQTGLSSQASSAFVGRSAFMAGADKPMNNQRFHIGSLPLLNAILLQNSPRQLATDRLFQSLARGVIPLEFLTVRSTGEW